MGYYTNFNLTIDCFSSEEENEVYKYVEDNIELLNCADCFLHMEDDAMKWYDWEKDMKIISKAFPDYLFILRGEGEESGDLWVSYLKGGKNQYCKARIKFDDFDESKLKE